MGRDEVIVLDTHVVVWWLQKSDRLTAYARDEMEREPRVMIPDIVCWEIAQLTKKGRVRFGRAPNEVMQALLGEPGIFLQHITPEIGRRAAYLVAPNMGLDPADQLVAATALELDCPLVTSDERLRSIPGLQVMW